jgi:hypothetical protein
MSRSNDDFNLGAGLDIQDVLNALDRIIEASRRAATEVERAFSRAGNTQGFQQQAVAQAQAAARTVAESNRVTAATRAATAQTNLQAAAIRRMRAETDRATAAQRTREAAAKADVATSRGAAAAIGVETAALRRRSAELRLSAQAQQTDDAARNRTITNMYRLTQATQRLGAILTTAVTLPLVATAKTSVDAAVEMDAFRRALNAMNGSSA